MNSHEKIRNSKHPIRWERCSILQFLRVAALLSTFTVSMQAAAEVVAWGDNSLGQTNVPAVLSNVVAIAAGGAHSLALKADGSVIAWGDNRYGQTNVPAGLSNVVAIAGGGMHSLALRADGRVVAWGDNWHGQTEVPEGLSNVVAIAGGVYHGLALRADGTVAAWGEFSDGVSATAPPSLNNIVAVAGASVYGLALDADGNVFIWDSHTNVLRCLTNVVAVAGGSACLALRVDGTIVAGIEGAWNLPADLTNVVAIANGGGLSQALRANSTVVAWGYYFNGSATVPITVPAGLSNVVQIASGDSHNLALIGSFQPVFLRQPINRTINVGSTIELISAATGLLPLHYQWQVNGTNLVSRPGAIGEKTPVLTLKEAQTADNGYYSVIVTNAYGSVTSAAAMLVVTQSPPVFVSQSLSRGNNLGTTATFNTKGNCSGAFHWLRQEWAAIEGTAKVFEHRQPVFA